jgi:aryl-alcohol dehydrogenase-like predicted oxidoreductase
VRHRPLGNTGLSVSEIGFGCGPTAGLMIDGSAAERRDAVARALALGIDYFDTAPAYGDRLSEANLGRCLRELGATPHVATKVALDAGDFDDIGGAVIRSVEASRERLGVTRIDLIQLHNRVAFERAPKAAFGTGALLGIDDVLGRGGVVEAFARLRERGLGRFFGCSGYGGDPAAVMRLIDSGAFDVIMASYSLLNPSAWRAMPPGTGLRDYGEAARKAAEAGMGVVALRALEGGLLAGEESRGNERRGGPDAAAMRSNLPRALELARRVPCALPELALRFALSNAGLATVLVGFSDPAQIEAAARYTERGPLDEAMLSRLGRMFDDPSGA